jgi:hypothetical protein
MDVKTWDFSAAPAWKLYDQNGTVKKKNKYTTQDLHMRCIKRSKVYVLTSP